MCGSVHDLQQRNAVSEALQSALQQAHTSSGARLAAVRGREALLARWQEALHSGSQVAATLWAVLTHRWGQTVQDNVLFDARAWAVEQARLASDCRRARQTAEWQAQQSQHSLQQLQLRVTQDKSEQAEQGQALHRRPSSAAACCVWAACAVRRRATNVCLKARAAALLSMTVVWKTACTAWRRSCRRPTWWSARPGA